VALISLLVAVAFPKENDCPHGRVIGSLILSLHLMPDSMLLLPGSLVLDAP